MKHATDGQNLPIRCSIYMLQKHILTYLLTYSMKKSPSWEANWFSASQEISHILWKPGVHYRVHSIQPAVPQLSQSDPVHSSLSHVVKIHFNITFLSTTRSSKWCLSHRFHHQNPACTSPVPNKCYMPCPNHSSRFGHPNNIWWRVHIMKLLIM